MQVAIVFRCACQHAAKPRRNVLDNGPSPPLVPASAVSAWQRRSPPAPPLRASRDRPQRSPSGSEVASRSAGCAECRRRMPTTTRARMTQTASEQAAAGVVVAVLAAAYAGPRCQRMKGEAQRAHATQRPYSRRKHPRALTMDVVQLCVGCVARRRIIYHAWDRCCCDYARARSRRSRAC